jgi:hypothetical protein
MWVVGLTMLSMSLSVAAAAAEPPNAPAATEAAPDAHPELRRLSKTDEIWLDIPGKRVVVGGKVALPEGVLEVFACPVLSKEHEAVVATNCSAKIVHAGLLAIGLEPGKAATFLPEYVPAQGSKVSVRVRWTDAEGKVQERPAREWVRNATTGKELDVDWVFTGSGFWRDPTDGTEHYEADAGDMICLSNFPSAMLDVPLESSDANDDLMFEAFEGRVPPHGTPVELILAPAE